MAFYFNRFLFTVYWFVFFACLIIILWDFQVVIVPKHSFASNIRIRFIPNFNENNQTVKRHTLCQHTNWWRPKKDSEKAFRRRKKFVTKSKVYTHSAHVTPSLHISVCWWVCVCVYFTQAGIVVRFCILAHIHTSEQSLCVLYPNIKLKKSVNFG